jgi:hypothetical protein
MTHASISTMTMKLEVGYSYLRSMHLIFLPRKESLRSNRDYHIYIRDELTAWLALSSVESQTVVWDRISFLRQLQSEGRVSLDTTQISSRTDGKAGAKRHHLTPEILIAVESILLVLGRAAEDRRTIKYTYMLTLQRESVIGHFQVDGYT